MEKKGKRRKSFGDQGRLKVYLNNVRSILFPFCMSSPRWRRIKISKDVGSFFPPPHILLSTLSLRFKNFGARLTDASDQFWWTLRQSAFCFLPKLSRKISNSISSDRFKSFCSIAFWISFAHFFFGCKLITQNFSFIIRNLFPFLKFLDLC